MAKIHRFIGAFDLSGNIIEILGEEAYQIRNVLHLKVGEKIEISNGKTISAMAEIESMTKEKITAKILEKNKIEIPQKNISLFCAVLKKENFELVVQKATECGVSKIIPIITTRTIKTGLNLERLNKIAKEASEQSGRNFVPEISEIQNFENVVENTKDQSILFDISGSNITRNSNLDTRNLFIGPEGGWTPEEIKLAKENNFEIYSLGENTLRGETAAIIATYLVCNFA